MPQFVPKRDQRAPYPFRQDVIAVIPNGGHTSNGYIDLEGCWTVVGIYMPAAWTAANIAFLTVYPLVTGSDDPDIPVTGAVWEVINEPADTVDFEVQVTAGEYTYIGPDKLAGCRYLRIRSQTDEVEVPQGAARTVRLVIRPV